MSEANVTLRLLEDLARNLDGPRGQADDVDSSGLDAPGHVDVGGTLAGTSRAAVAARISSVRMLEALAGVDFDLYRAAVVVARGD
jgi:hypothetical protein